MRFTVFGGITAWVDGREADLGLAQRRAVLGVLLTTGAAVTADELIERVWGATPPTRARAVLQTYLARLRQAVPGLIERDGAGYAVRVDPLTVDLHLFRAHARGGRLAEALRLVSGPLLSTLDTPWARETRAAFESELRDVRLRHTDARLQAGDHAALVDELQLLAARHPLDERVAAQLIEALHGSGRTTEAVKQFEAIRAHLATELGADPSKQLLTLHRRMLNAPRQLPAAPKSFTGRTNEIEQLTNAPTGVVVITGTGGVGKTSLAVHWAHQAADRFPDGQLYVNLHGFGPSGAAVTPSEALLRFLAALDVPRSRVSADPAEQRHLLRETLRGKRVLIVLDNARDTAHVDPLLPYTPGTHVVITSRDSLTGLLNQGAHAVPLGLLPAADARELLAHRIGHHRAAAEPAALNAVVRRCARLPLALAVAGARAATHPQFPLSALATELGDLDAFADDDSAADLRSVFSHSVEALSATALRLFRLLGLMPGPDISAAGAASLTGRPIAETREALAELIDAHLLTEDGGRFTFHDLLRDYAAELAGTNEPAHQRLLDHLALTAVDAAIAISPSRHRPDTPDPAPGAVHVPPDTIDEARDWLVAERVTLLAAMAQGTPAQTWLIGWSLADVLDRQGHWPDFLTSQQDAVKAVEQLDDRDGLGRTLVNLGRAHSRLQQHDQARAALNRAFEVYEGDALGQGAVLLNLAMQFGKEGRLRDTIDQTRKGLALFEQAGYDYGQANALTGLAWAYAELEEFAESLEYGTRALQLYQRIGHITGQGEALDNIGAAHHGLRRYDEAARAFEQAAERFRRGGDRIKEALVYDELGDTLAAAGKTGEAHEAWHRAVALYRESDRPVDHIVGKLQPEREQHGTVR